MYIHGRHRRCTEAKIAQQTTKALTTQSSTARAAHTVTHQAEHRIRNKQHTQTNDTNNHTHTHIHHTYTKARFTVTDTSAICQ
jgi:hypothetical protein